MGRGESKHEEFHTKKNKRQNEAIFDEDVAPTLQHPSGTISTTMKRLIGPMVAKSYRPFRREGLERVIEPLDFHQERS